VNLLIEVKRINSNPRKKSIFVICPKCGKVGKLRVLSKNIFGKRKYAIDHGEYKCKISFFDGEIWDMLDEVYRKVRRNVK